MEKVGGMLNSEGDGNEKTRVFPPNYCLLIRASDTSEKRLARLYTHARGLNSRMGDHGAKNDS